MDDRRDWRGVTASSVCLARFCCSCRFGYVAFLMIMPSIPRSAQAATELIEDTAEATQGRHLFFMNCAHSQGVDARGDEDTDLHDLHKTDSRIHKVITAGIKGEMPSFAKKL